MGAGVFHGRVRDGIGCRLPAMATRSSNPPVTRANPGWVRCDGVWRDDVIKREKNVRLMVLFIFPVFGLPAWIGGGGPKTSRDGGWMIAVQDGVVCEPIG
jgi:hypothetical protein